MRVLIEINDNNKDKVINQANELETGTVPVIDSGGPEGSSGNVHGLGKNNPEETINAGEVPNELLELMANTSTFRDIEQKSINSGAAPNED